MDDIDQMLQARAGAPESGDVDALLADRAAGHKSAPVPRPTVPLSSGSRFWKGFTDLPTGLGQFTEHVAETPLNWLRKGIRGALNLTGATEAAQLFGDVSTKDFDQIVAQRERDYQQERADAHQSGIDWWRIGGNAANPVNYLAPGGAAASVGGRIGQAAAQGAFVGGMSPSAEPGNFWADKAKGAAVGGVAGAATSGVIEAAMPALKWGTSALRKAFGSGADDAAKAAGAERVVNETLKAQGVDPATVDIDVLKSMRQEVKEALDAKMAPNPTAIRNRADAESLPVPVKLMRGQATRDALQFAQEQNLRGIQGIGEPLTNRLTEQNRALVENLNAMGARNAPDPVSSGGTLAEHIRSIDETLKSKVGEAYDAVRNSAGQPAAMDGVQFARNVRASLDEEFQFLPKEVQGTIEALSEGKLPLTVKRAQVLDKAWTGLQSGAPISDTTDRAIEIAKQSLLDAPLTDSVGAESIAAYKAAKSLARDRFQLIDSNPAYKAVIRGMKSAEPDQFFKRFVMSGTAREVESLKSLMQAADPKAPELIGRTLMGEIKRGSLNGSEESGAFSQAKFSKFVNDPVWKARLQSLLPTELVGNLQKLGRVAEVVQRPPVASAVNTSNTGSAVVNAVKAGAFEKLNRVGSHIPGFATAAKTGAETAKQARLERAVSESLSPGVTIRSLPRLTPEQVAALRAASVIATPAAVAAAQEK